MTTQTNKIILGKLYVLVLLMLASLSGYGQTAPLTRAQFLEDLTMLETKLKRHHPNLHTHQTPASVNAHLARLRDDAQEEVSHRVAYASIASLCTMIQDGHIVVLPSAEKLVAYEQTEALFPFDVVARGERLYVVRDYQPTEDLAAGSEILQVNGMPVNELIDFLRHRLPTDGPKGTYADWILSTYLRAYYFFFFPQAEAFDLVLKRPGEVQEHLKVNGITLSQMERVRRERFPAYATALADRKLNPIKFDVQPKKSLAILSIHDFHRSAHRKAGQKFTKIIDEAMADFASKKVEHLVIDLRDNQGGDLVLGHYLLQYLLEDPFKTVDHFARVKHPEAISDKLRVRAYENRLTMKRIPRENRYRGKVYLLTNGGSFSNSGIFAWMIRKHKRGLILGNTTGGSSWSLCGGPNKRIRLPNSGIQVEIPTTRYALHPANEVRGGVVPDKIILPTPLDLATGNDAVLNAVMLQIEPAPIDQ